MAGFEVNASLRWLTGHRRDGQRHNRVALVARGGYAARKVIHVGRSFYATPSVLPLSDGEEVPGVDRARTPAQQVGPDLPTGGRGHFGESLLHLGVQIGGSMRRSGRSRVFQVQPAPEPRKAL
jgi:hypothetical protein